MTVKLKSNSELKNTLLFYDFFFPPQLVVLDVCFLAAAQLVGAVMGCWGLSGHDGLGRKAAVS